MRTFVVIVGFLFGGTALGQSSATKLLSVCQLLAAPARYSGKLVVVKAQVTGPRRVQLLDPADPACGRIPWMYPTDQDVKPKPKFSLVKDEMLKKLQDSFGLMLPPPPGSARQISQTIAVLEGRFDSVYRLQNGKPVRSRRGIGYREADDQVFVLHRVIEVTVMPVENRDWSGQQQEQQSLQRTK